MEDFKEVVYDACLYTVGDNILLNVQDGDLKMVYHLQCRMHKDADNARRQLAVIKAIEAEYSLSGILSGRLSYSSSLKQIEGNLCTFSMSSTIDGFSGTWSFRMSSVEFYEGDGCFPFRCQH